MSEIQRDHDIAVRWEINPEPLFAQTEAEAIVDGVCAAIARKAELEAVELSLSFVDEQEIQDLNRQYRGIDAVTDVLSFSLLEGDEPEVIDEAGPLALGDIVICWPVLAAQAREYGHAPARELAFLTAHGMLHLLGYDNETHAEEQAMTALQEEVLTTIGITR